jgi:hypothetical protein
MDGYQEKSETDYFRKIRLKTSKTAPIGLFEIASPKSRITNDG